MAFDYFKVEFVPGQFHHCASGYAFQNIICDWWSDQFSIPDHEEVFGAALRDMAVVVEDQGLVKAGAQRIGLDECGIYISASDLSPGRDGIVVHPPPGRNCDVSACIIGDIFSEWDGEDGQFGLQVVQLDADDLIAEIHQGTDVDVLPISLSLQQFNSDLGQLFRGVAGIHQHQLGGIQETFVMVNGTKDKEFLFGFIPITPNPAKNSGSIIQRMGHHPDFCIGVWHDLAAKIGIIWDGQETPPARFGPFFRGQNIITYLGNEFSLIFALGIIVATIEDKRHLEIKNLAKGVLEIDLALKPPFARFKLSSGVKCKLFRGGSPLKRAVSISIGSSKRDKALEVKLLGETVRIERIGTDGDMEKAAELFKELDGKVDAFGLGGADLGILVANKFYPLYSVQPMVRQVKKTPLVDGEGLKNTLENRTVGFMHSKIGDYIKEKKALITSGADRWGMTTAFEEAGYQCVYGDLMFGLGLPIALHSANTIKRIAPFIMPIAGRLPFKWVYPTGEKQEKREPKWVKYYQWATVIAGDMHYVRRHIPESLPGKIVVTNTTTLEDVELLRKIGIKYLVTTTPVMDGRSFGTNMLEAALVAASGKERRLTHAELNDLIDQLKLEPQIQELN